MASIRSLLLISMQPFLCAMALATAPLYLDIQYRYDVLGNKRAMMLTGDQDDKGHRITSKSYWQRDLFGNTHQKYLCVKSGVAECEDNEQSIEHYYRSEQFTYNEAGQLTNIINQHGFAEKKLGTYEAHDYYDNGMVKSSTALDGTMFHYLYDHSGQEIERYIGNEKVKQYQLIHCYDTPLSSGMPVCSDQATTGLIAPPYTGRLVALKAYWHQHLTNQINYTYTADGKIESVIYHANLQEHETAGHLNQTIVYRYNQYEEVASVKDALNHVTLHQYDTFGRHQSSCLQGDIAGVCGREKVSYHYVSKREHKTDENLCSNEYLPSQQMLHNGHLQCVNFSNGTQKQFYYDGYGRKQQVNLVNSRMNKLITGQRYGYDNITGNIVQITHQSQLEDGLSSNYQQNYQYNVLNQLQQSYIIDPKNKTKAKLNHTTFSYDERGNLLKKEVNNTTDDQIINVEYQYNQLNQLTSFSSAEHKVKLCQNADNRNQCISYDQNGNMLSDGLGNLYQYNALNQLVGFHNPDAQISAQYDYLANGLRQSKVVSEQTKQYDQIYFYYNQANYPEITNEIQVDRSHQQVASTHYLLSGDRSFRYFNASNDKPVQKHQLLTGHKSILGNLDQSGQLEKYNYTDYGQSVSLDKDRLVTKGNKANRHTLSHNSFKYNAEYTDAESGLYYLRARFYHPQLHRFPQRDSKALLNRYQYADNNPVMMVDPSGHMAGMVLWGIINIGLTGGALYEDAQIALGHKKIDEWLIADVVLNMAALFSDLGMGLSMYDIIKTRVLAKKFAALESAVEKEEFIVSYGRRLGSGEYGNVYKFNNMAYKIYKRKGAYSASSETTAQRAARIANGLSVNQEAGFQIEAVTDNMTRMPLVKVGASGSELRQLEQQLWGQDRAYIYDLNTRNVGKYNGKNVIFDADERITSRSRSFHNKQTAKKIGSWARSDKPEDIKNTRIISNNLISASGMSPVQAAQWFNDIRY